ncbi:MAG: hypothetical protein JW910_05595, partial [Anaerolineae bacterium]|nr:hypothetical protein [Anaerolineae bacterium]
FLPPWLRLPILPYPWPLLCPNVLVGRIQKFKGAGVEFETDMTPSPKTLTAPDHDEEVTESAEDKILEEHMLPLDCIREALQKIPDLGETPERREMFLPRVRTLLLYNGVFSPEQLDQLVTSNRVLNILRALFITELERDPEVPLDPVAIASHGAFLFTRGTTPDIVEAVRNAIRNSPEYRELQRIAHAGKVLTDLTASSEDQIEAARTLGSYPRNSKSLGWLLRASELHTYGPVQAEIAEQIGNVATPNDERAIDALSRLETRTDDPSVQNAVSSSLNKLKH